MVSRTPKSKYERDMRRLRGDVPDDERRDDVLYGDDLPDDDRERIEQFVKAYNEDDLTVSTPDGESGKSFNTLARYITNLIRVAGRTELATSDTDDINQACKDIKDDGRAKSTVRQIQLTCRSFYRFHDDLPADPDGIATYSRPESKVDETDMLTRDEIERLRDSTDHPRDRCIVDLLLFTGMRVGALRTLRVKDVAPEDGPSGRYWLNTDADGLKGADERNGGRPLLGAKTAVRDWLKYHPTGEDDHYLLTAKPKWNKTDPTVPVTNETPRRVLSNLKDETGIDKPLHPHAVRHNFVTICVRDYDMDESTIKYLIGHSPDSNVMETTYQHLSGEDHSTMAEDAAGFEVDDDESRLSPEQCDVCGATLPENAKACPRCGHAYTPDAKQVQDDAKGDVMDTHRQASESGDDDMADLMEEMISQVDDPELIQRLAEATESGSD